MTCMSKACEDKNNNGLSQSMGGQDLSLGKNNNFKDETDETKRGAREDKDKDER